MLRPKLMASLAIVALALSALFIVPAMTFAAPGKPAVKPNTPVTFYYGFNATITQGQNKGTSIVGGLTLNVSNSGAFYGHFTTPGQANLNVNGRFSSPAIITIHFLKQGVPIMLGVGQVVGQGLITGNFTVLTSGVTVASGIWSALGNAYPTTTVAQAFYGRVKDGSGVKLNITGPVVLNAPSLKPGVTIIGTINFSDGTIYTVRATADHTGHLQLKFVTNSGHAYLTAIGVPFYDSQAKLLGYRGTIVGPGQTATGVFESDIFQCTLN